MSVPKCLQNGVLNQITFEILCVSSKQACRCVCSNKWQFQSSYKCPWSQNTGAVKNGFLTPKHNYPLFQQKLIFLITLCSRGAGNFPTFQLGTDFSFKWYLEVMVLYESWFEENIENNKHPQSLSKSLGNRIWCTKIVEGKSGSCTVFQGWSQS